MDRYAERAEVEIQEFRGRAAEAVISLLKHGVQDMHHGLLPDGWTERLDRTSTMADGKEETGSVIYRFKKKVLLVVHTTLGDKQPFSYSTITTAPHAVTFTGPWQVDPLNDVGYHTTPGVYDLLFSAISASPMVPGYNGQLWFTVSNVGTVATSAEITYTIDPHQSFVSASPVPTSVTGNTVNWSRVI